MANGSASTKRIIGIILVVIGVGLAYWAYRMSGSIGSQVTQTVTGSPTDKVMTYYIGGAVSLAVGLFLLFKK